MAENTSVNLIQPNLGLDADALQKTVEALQHVLADQHVLYMKTRNYHWNVTGMAFGPLHELFEEQYDGMAEQIDETAERIRQAGARALGSMKEMLEHARLTEAPAEVRPATQMVRDLLEDHEAFIRYLRADIEVMDEIDNDGAEDYLIGLMQAHEKIAWMLRAHLEG